MNLFPKSAGAWRATVHNFAVLTAIFYIMLFWLGSCLNVNRFFQVESKYGNLYSGIALIFLTIVLKVSFARSLRSIVIAAIAIGIGCLPLLSR
ncbi:MAG: hypothetical protein DHS20C16_29830 [Phycisphaerae bacterium]|nr:MAG: hypothetical protein DHS20C16_29830 [Phycisphaerae bacterium]